jgi:hypothetical protein
MQSGHDRSGQHVKVKTHVVLAIDTSAIARRSISHAEIILDTIWAACGVRDEMGWRRLRSLYLNEAFRANGVIAASRVVNIRWVVLCAEQFECVQTQC